ncbi:MAG: DUF3570 domain-containing protein [Fibrobacterota bacterium]|nr:DUF3570 domain-containing protein [Fibrobacterota bacterium]
MLTPPRVRTATGKRLPKRIKILAAFLCGLAAAPSALSAAETDHGLDVKYMYYWDRNGAWNHTPAFAYIRKIASRWKLQWDQELDAVSGASRRLGLKNIGRLADHDQLLDGVTGASKREVRHSEQATLAYAEEGRTASASFYFSDESDYRSYSPSLSASRDFNDRNTTLGGSAAMFFDEMRPTGPFVGMGGKRSILSLTGTLAQVLTPLNLSGLTVNVIHSSGFLGHPYNPVITADGNMVTENLPDRKTGFSLSGQVIQGFHIGDRLGSVRLEARHYRDDWELVSNTADIHWYQYLLEGTYVRLRARGYRQGAAAFAKHAYDGGELYRTPAIRFYAFSSLTLGLKVGSIFPESWGGYALLPDRWDLSYDHGVRDTKGEDDGITPAYRYQLFPKDEYYMQGTLMAGLAFDL